MQQIEPGARVLVRSADNRLVARRAVTGVVQGRDFPVIWVCHEDAWDEAHLGGQSPQGLPWPADAVQLNAH
jgi:hypothetical protein